jgi:hypothetical protein
MDLQPAYIWGVAEITEGTEERQAFAEHYGGISNDIFNCGGDVQSSRR